jgi:hypothetical protein
MDRGEMSANLETGRVSVSFSSIRRPAADQRPDWGGETRPVDRSRC